MQASFVILYLTLYIFNIFFLFLLLGLFTPLTYLLTLSVKSIFDYLRIYTNYINFVYFIFFVLSGLPPVGLFFFKLNLLTFCLCHWGFFLTSILFIYLFISIIFYLSIFKFRSELTPQFKLFYSDSSFNSSLYSSQEGLLSHNYFNPILKSQSRCRYNIVFFFLSYVFFNFFCIFWINDIFLILLNLSLV